MFWVPGDIVERKTKVLETTTDEPNEADYIPLVCQSLSSVNMISCMNKYAHKMTCDSNIFTKLIADLYSTRTGAFFKRNKFVC